MSARGRFLSGLVAVAIALAGFCTVGALPAAASPRIVQYVALGDSYAAGQGGGRYLNDCLQTAKSYPKLLNLESRIELEANPTCSGATTDDVADEQLKALNENTRLVTLTVGAADLHLSAVLAVCSDPTRTLECLATIQTVRNNLLPTLAGDLEALYLKVAAAAPRARIVVTGYPHLLEPTAPFDPRIIAAVNLATDELNAAIRKAVSATNDADVNIHYVDVTAEFAGHGIGSADPWINVSGPDAFHPNAYGYEAYADAISAVLPGGWLDKQRQQLA